MRLNLAQFFDPSSSPDPYNILVLNQKIDQTQFQIIYERATIKICADGGYRRLKDWMTENGQKIASNQPDFVIGDLDSIEETPIADSASGPPKTIQIHDQNRTDLEKSIDYILENNSNPQVFILIGALGGRFDHEIGSLNSLFKYSEHQLILLNNQSAVTLIKRGVTNIKIDNKFVLKTCGFAPFAEPANVSTSGFKWNVSTEMQLGKFISESNIIIGDEAQISTDHPLILSVELCPE